MGTVSCETVDAAGPSSSSAKRILRASEAVRPGCRCSSINDSWLGGSRGPPGALSSDCILSGGVRGCTRLLRFQTASGGVHVFWPRDLRDHPPVQICDDGLARTHATRETGLFPHSANMHQENDTTMSRFTNTALWPVSVHELRKPGGNSAKHRNRAQYRIRTMTDPADTDRDEPVP